MALVLRGSACLALAVCGWMGADGLRRAGAGVPFDRVYVRWDANRLPENASDARILALRPTSPFARYRDALSRADLTNSPVSGLTRNGTVPGGEEFRIAARGVLKWGRNQPGTLLELGQVALARARDTESSADREIGEALLLEYTRRTTHAENEGVKAWKKLAAPSRDPIPVWKDAPKALWPVVGGELSTSHPDAAWTFLVPSIEDGTFPASYAGHVLSIARNRRQPGDVRILKILANRADLTPEATRDLRGLIAEIEAVR